MKKLRGLWMKGINKPKEHMKTKLICLTLTEVFLIQKRINLCLV